MNSCTPLPNKTSGGDPSRGTLPAGDIESIRKITDQVLVALSSRQYQRLSQWVEPGKVKLTPRQMAEFLLGSQMKTAVIDGWDPRLMAITPKDGGDRADCRVSLNYRASPNRPPQKVVFHLRFYRSLSDHRWYLYFPSS